MKTIIEMKDEDSKGFLAGGVAYIGEDEVEGVEF